MVWHTLKTVEQLIEQPYRIQSQPSLLKETRRTLNIEQLIYAESSARDSAAANFMEQQKKPSGFEDYLSEYSIVLFDGYSGEPVAWGFRIIRYLGEDLFRDLGKHGVLKCIDAFKSSWALIIKTLSREEANEKYGSITNEVFGPRGGWKSSTFGDKTFISDYLRPKKK